MKPLKHGFKSSYKSVVSEMDLLFRQGIGGVINKLIVAGNYNGN